MLEKTLENPLDCKKIQPINPKGNQLWIFIGRADAEIEALILGPPDVKNWLIWKDGDAGKDWRQDEKGTTEDEMAGWHHWLDGCESEWTPGVGDGQEGLACCGSWGSKESEMTERLNWTELITLRSNSVFPHSSSSMNHSISPKFYDTHQIAQHHNNLFTSVPTMR